MRLVALVVDLSETGIGQTIVDLISAAIVILGAYLLARWVVRWANKAFGGSSGGEASLIVNIVRALLVGGAIYFVGENVFDIELDGLVQAFGLTTLAVTLSVQELLVNLVAGIQILVTKVFSVGDQIEIDGARGEVLDITWRQTIIRDKDNNPHIIPNSKLMSNSFLRLNDQMARRYIIQYDIKPGLDLERVAADIERLANETLVRHGWKAEEDTEVRYLGSTANGVIASVRIYLKDVSFTTPAMDAVSRAIGQRGYLADRTKESPDQEQWR